MHLSELDKNLLWHPFTQEKTASPPIFIKKAKGSYVYDLDSNAYLDLISSWWVNIHGHGHPEIAASIYKQSLNLEHVIFAGFTHEAAINLCANLKNVLPKSLCRFFFSDNGSTCVEVALKMAYQYWQNVNQPQRKLFLSFEGGYHGDTFGAMAVGKKSGFHDIYNELFFDVVSLPFPDTFESDNDVITKEQHSLNVLAKHLEVAGDKIAAIILEPLVQGAGGMRMCRPEFIESVIREVRKYNILVIFDEVMTGFGRTGKLFAYEHLNSVPDFLCLSKGITGGFLPLALTITTNDIYQAFLDNKFSKAFAHGHSYTANPIACAAAITSLELLLREETVKAINDIHDAHVKGLAYLQNNCQNIENMRICGTISAFKVISNMENLNQHLKNKFLNKGLLIRPLADTVYLLPPYSTTSDELASAYHMISEVLRDLDSDK